MNKLLLILILFFCCSSCINEENILPAKDKLSNKNSSGKETDRTKNDDKNSDDDDDDDDDKKKDKDKNKKDKKDNDDEDEDDKKDKNKNKKDDDDRKKDKKDDNKEGKKDDKGKNNSASTFLYACDQSKSLSDSEASAAFANRTWTAMLKNNAGQFEAYRLATTQNNITTSFAAFSDCRTEINSYTALVINHTWSGRVVNTGNADDSFRIGCMNGSYFEAIYSNGKVLHFYDEDRIKFYNIDRCKLKFTILN